MKIGYDSRYLSEICMVFTTSRASILLPDLTACKAYVCHVIVQYNTYKCDSALPPYPPAWSCIKRRFRNGLPSSNVLPRRSSGCPGRFSTADEEKAAEII